MRRLVPILFALGVALVVLIAGWFSFPECRWLTPFYRNFQVDLLRENWDVFWRSGWSGLTLQVAIGAGLLSAVLWLLTPRRPRLRWNSRATGPESVPPRKVGIWETLTWIGVPLAMAWFILSIHYHFLQSHH